MLPVHMHLDLDEDQDGDVTIGFISRQLIYHDSDDYPSLPTVDSGLRITPYSKMDKNIYI